MYKVTVNRHLNPSTERTFNNLNEVAMFITNVLWTELSLTIWDIEVSQNNNKLNTSEVMNKSTNNYIIGGAYAC